MSLTPEQWLILGSYLVTLVLGYLNFRSSFLKSKASSKLDEGTNIKTLNEAVVLANNRALQSEKEREEKEVKFDDREQRLNDRIDVLESKLNLVTQENITLKSEMAEMHMKQAMSQKLIEGHTLAQKISQQLIEEQRNEIIALQDFSERLIAEIIRSGGTPLEYKPGKL